MTDRYQELYAEFLAAGTQVVQISRVKNAAGEWVERKKVVDMTPEAAAAFAANARENSENPTMYECDVCGRCSPEEPTCCHVTTEETMTTDDMVDLYIDYAERKLRKLGYGPLQYGPDEVRQSLHLAVAEGILRLEMEGGELVATWKTEPGREERTYPSRHLPDLH